MIVHLILILKKHTCFYNVSDGSVCVEKNWLSSSEGHYFLKEIKKVLNGQNQRYNRVPMVPIKHILCFSIMLYLEFNTPAAGLHYLKSTDNKEQ